MSVTLKQLNQLIFGLLDDYLGPIIPRDLINIIKEYHIYDYLMFNSFKPNSLSVFIKQGINAWAEFMVLNSDVAWIQIISHTQRYLYLEVCIRMVESIYETEYDYKYTYTGYFVDLLSINDSTSVENADDIVSKQVFKFIHNLDIIGILCNKVYIEDADHNNHHNGHTICYSIDDEQQSMLDYCEDFIGTDKLHKVMLQSDDYIAIFASDTSRHYNYFHYYQITQDDYHDVGVFDTFSNDRGEKWMPVCIINNDWILFCSTDWEFLAFWNIGGDCPLNNDVKDINSDDDNKNDDADNKNVVENDDTKDVIDNDKDESKNKSHVNLIKNSDYKNNLNVYIRELPKQEISMHVKYSNGYLYMWPCWIKDTRVFYCRVFDSDGYLVNQLEWQELHQVVDKEDLEILEIFKSLQVDKLAIAKKSLKKFE